MQPRLVSAAHVGSDPAGWIRARRGDLQADLDDVGAVLFRGLPLTTGTAVAEVLAALDRPLSTYRQGLSRRQEVAPGIYTSTTWPADQRIILHSELCHTSAPPTVLFLCCPQPAPEGGATPLCDTETVLDQLDPEVREGLLGHTLTYIANQPDAAGPAWLGRSWQAVHGTQDRSEVEARLAGEGVAWEWREGGGLYTRWTGPVTVAHPRTGRRVWFNQAALWHVSNLGSRGAQLRRMLGEDGVPTNVFIDGDQSVPDAWLDQIRQRMWQAAWRLQWQAGDLLVIDNHRVAHGREPFTGERSVWVAMS